MTKTETKKNQEPTDISKLVKKSLAEVEASTPENITMKSDADGHTHLIEATRGQKTEIYNYLHSIGADNQILSDHNKAKTRKDRNRAVLNKWFQVLVIQNDRFPREVPIELTLRHFHQKVVQNKIDIHGFNLRSQVKAFHQYLDRYEKELRSKWRYMQNPEDRPNLIPKSTTQSEEVRIQDDEQRSKNIKKMYGANIPESLQKYVQD